MRKIEVMGSTTKNQVHGRARRPILSRAALALSVALACCAGVGAARAQDPQRLTIDGEWTLAISEDAARERIARGIEGATEGMPPLTDAIAARVLRERTPLIRRVRIASTPARIVVDLDHRHYDSAPGVPYDIQSGDEQVRVTQHFREGVLEQVFATPRGTRWNTFRLDDHGGLTIEAVVQSDRLPAPLRFTLPYRPLR